MSKATVDAGKSSGEEPSAYLKSASACGRINVRMVQNVLLIWLDSNIDDISSDCQNTITQLRHAVNNVNTFTDAEQCIHFLGDMHEEKACMIISGAFGQQIVPLVHNMPQVDSIFLFCGDKKYHEEWTEDWSKIKGVFTDIQPICKALEDAAQHCEQSAISISIMDTSDDLSKKSLDQVDPSFMYTQIMKEILLSIEFDPHHIQEFIQYCREELAGNEGQLKHVDKLEQQYRKQTPIWWYTCECFLYPMLNRALRIMDGDLIIRLGFFVGDLHRQIKQLHQKQFSDHSFKKHFTVYRGQGMAKGDSEKMTATKGGLLSFNCFLSTSKHDQVSLKFAQHGAKNPDMVAVLFVMTIDPTRFSTPFASVVNVGYFGVEEEEVLFSMHTVFRIGEITPTDENHRLFQVKLKLTSDEDNDLRQLTDHIREETFPSSRGWYRLDLLLWKMGQPAKAQQVYEILLKQTKEERSKAAIYNQLGVFKKELGEYPKAIAYFEKYLQISKKTLPPNHPELALSYNNIGSVHNSMGDYPKALSSYEKARAIKQQSLLPTHPAFGSSYNNFGEVYHSMGDYPKALSSYEKALAIDQQSLPSNHPNLASSYENVGLVYEDMGDYPKALSSFEKSLAIRQQSLPPNHPHLAQSYNNTGLVYYRVRDYPKALSSFEKALAIRQQSLPLNHPHLATSYNNIGSVYQNMSDYPKALSSYEKALAIQQQSLPPNHPHLAQSYNNIGVVYQQMGYYSKALSSLEKALAIQQQSLPPNHPDLASSYNNIGLVYYRVRDYPKALSSFEKALAIQQQSLPPNHPDLASSYGNIGNVYREKGDYPKALSSYEKALAIQQQSLPPNHPDVVKSYINIGGVYYSMGDYPKALPSCEKALAMQQESLAPDHPNLAISRYNIDLLYESMSNYSKSHSSYERGIDTGQHALPPNHPDLQQY